MFIIEMLYFDNSKVYKVDIKVGDKLAVGSRGFYI